MATVICYVLIRHYDVTVTSHTGTPSSGSRWRRVVDVRSPVEVKESKTVIFSQETPLPSHICRAIDLTVPLWDLLHDQ